MVGKGGLPPLQDSLRLSFEVFRHPLEASGIAAHFKK